MTGPGRIATYAAAAGVGLLASELAWAVTRPLPSLENLDPSGVEGRADGHPLTMAVLGDSSCTGPGLENPSEIWTRVFARGIGDRFRVDVRSFAVGGAKARDVVDEQLHQAVALAPDLTIISVGGNDALRGVTIREFRRHMHTITAEMTAASKLVALSGVGDLGAIPRLPRPLSDLARARGRALNRVHHLVGGQHGALVADQWTWSAPLFHGELHMFAADHFHASAAGHRVWAKVAHEVLDPHLDQFLPAPNP